MITWEDTMKKIFFLMPLLCLVGCSNIVEKEPQETVVVSKYAVPTYPGCDTPDIEIGEYTIAACNVGSSIAGTGEESYGKYYIWEEAQEVCSAGYHLPSIEEWQWILSSLRQEYPLYETVNPYVASETRWSLEDMQQIRKRMFFPFPGLFSHQDESVRDQEYDGNYRSSTVFEDGNYSPRTRAHTLRLTQFFIRTEARDIGLWLSVRCFKDMD